MADANEAYYGLAHDDELVEIFDQYERLPEPGTNPALDAFVERKHIDIRSLVRLGARLADQSVLVFGYPGGIKFRDVVTDKRWNWVGSEFKDLKIVHAGLDRARVAIVAEGETDACRLGTMYPDADIAVLPAGANPGRHAQRYAAQLADYELVLLAHDYGHAGEAGAAALQEHLTTKALRWLAPIEPADNEGWGDVPPDADVPALPTPESVAEPPTQRLWIPAGELLALEPPEIISHFEQAVLPVGGQLILHGAMKSFKSFAGLDLCAALAQSQPWCGFEPTDEPVKVMVMQYEIPWPFYQQRLRAMRAAAAEPKLFDENLLTYSPLSRPRLVAGNTAAEDEVLRALDQSGATVFMLDPIRRGVGMADLNSEKEVRPMLNFLQRVQDLGITVIATHHDNKAGSRQGGGSPLDMTGSGAFGGDADSIVSVVLPKGHELSSPERNLHFLLRNAPSPSGRSMRMADGTLTYDTYTVGEGEEQDAPPTPGSDEPSI